MFRASKLLLLFLLALVPVTAQTSTEETLSNESVIELAKAGLGEELLVSKINSSPGRYDLSVSSIVKLKEAGVSDGVIKAMMAIKPPPALRRRADLTDNTQPLPDRKEDSTDYNKTIVNAARTMSIDKSSGHPSRQALEKELLKRGDWKKLNISLVRYKNESDLTLQIGFVHGSIISHRYVFRIFDTKSGTVIAAGETTSWGSLAKNLAREITQKLGQTLSASSSD